LYAYNKAINFAFKMGDRCAIVHQNGGCARSEGAAHDLPLPVDTMPGSAVNDAINSGLKTPSGDWRIRLQQCTVN
jgi:hypothetical protein